jgi:hypothetical protein
MRSIRMLALVVSFVLTASACEEKKAAPAPPKIEAAAPAPAPAPAPDQAKAAVQDAAPAPAPAPAKAAAPAMVEVEMMGRVVVPEELQAKAPKPILLYVADEDCLDPKNHFFTIRQVGEDGRFFTEIFPPAGTDLSLCAAFDEGVGKPARAYGKLDHALHAVGIGEVVFSELEITLAKGKPKLFPKRPW